ncbi:unnamed protein product [Chironomus riparius]|uniref:Uncharacterized protein n=1 Tax=Chironomus riparius TaxID=315576 RepID=A0A9N9S949_9DIPT|nr:unnamed protein product [Chironomus riparius]
MNFHLFLDANNVENVCKHHGRDFSFFFHPPNEIITPFHDEGSVEYKFEKRVVVSITRFKNDDGLRNFPPTARGCYYAGEKSLQFFRIYTKSHCEFECLTNFTLKTCGCVKFSMPRVAGTKVCGMEKVQCYHNVWRVWPYYVPGKGKEAPCGCLKTCNHLEYKVRSERNSIYEDIREIETVRNVTNGSTYSFLSFEIKDHFHLSHQYYGPYTLQNFIADIGGLLALFLGISILSIFECLYALMVMIHDRMTQNNKVQQIVSSSIKKSQLHSKLKAGSSRNAKKICNGKLQNRSKIRNKNVENNLRTKIIEVKPCDERELNRGHPGNIYLD